MTKPLSMLLLFALLTRSVEAANKCPAESDQLQGIKALKKDTTEANSSTKWYEVSVKKVEISSLSPTQGWVLQWTLNKEPKVVLLKSNRGDYSFIIKNIEERVLLKKDISEVEKSRVDYVRDMPTELTVIDHSKDLKFLVEFFHESVLDEVMGIIQGVAPSIPDSYRRSYPIKKNPVNHHGEIPVWKITRGIIILALLGAAVGGSYLLFTRAAVRSQPYLKKRSRKGKGV